jgi:hypothetical protein
VQNDQSFLGMTANVESYRIAPNNMSSQSGPNDSKPLNDFLFSPKKKKKKNSKTTTKIKMTFLIFIFIFIFYEETFSPIPKMNSIRILLSIATI